MQLACKFLYKICKAHKKSVSVATFFSESDILKMKSISKAWGDHLILGVTKPEHDENFINIYNEKQHQPAKQQIPPAFQKLVKSLPVNVKIRILIHKNSSKRFWLNIFIHLALSFAVEGSIFKSPYNFKIKKSENLIW